MEHGSVGMLATSQRALFDGFVWLFFLLVAVALMVVAIALLRKRLRKRVYSERTDFSLDQLRRLRDRGDLTESEYEVLRGKVLFDP